jgi:4-amino-4-deoxy-L-arabinose transferase-like glycosyltransferase
MGAAMLAIAALAGRVGGARAALVAALGMACIPAFHATAMLMTIDGPYIACWAGVALAAWRLRECADSGRATTAWWIGLGACLGVGFLFKYTIVLIVPGLLLWAWAHAPERGTSRGTALRVALAATVFAAIVSPVVIWNQRHAWPTLAHLLGHVGAPGGGCAVFTTCAEPGCAGPGRNRC